MYEPARDVATRWFSTDMSYLVTPTSSPEAAHASVIDVVVPAIWVSRPGVEGDRMPLPRSERHTLERFEDR